jgi:hypothetical protein
MPAVNYAFVYSKPRNDDALGLLSSSNEHAAALGRCASQVCVEQRNQPQNEISQLIPASFANEDHVFIILSRATTTGYSRGGPATASALAPGGKLATRDVEHNTHSYS